MPKIREAMPAAAERDKDRPLREDTRLLGGILADTVREQQGERVFDVIERIRQTSIRFRRDKDEAARRELGEIMDGLSRARRARSSAPSVISRTSPIAPRTSTGSAAPGPMRSPPRRRATARWRRRWRAPATPASPGTRC